MTRTNHFPALLDDLVSGCGCTPQERVRALSDALTKAHAAVAGFAHTFADDEDDADDAGAESQAVDPANAARLARRRERRAERRAERRIADSAN